MLGNLASTRSVYAKGAHTASPGQRDFDRRVDEGWRCRPLLSRGGGAGTQLPTVVGIEFDTSEQVGQPPANEREDAAPQTSTTSSWSETGGRLRSEGNLELGGRFLTRSLTRRRPRGMLRIMFIVRPNAFVSLPRNGGSDSNAADSVHTRLAPTPLLKEAIRGRTQLSRQRPGPNLD